MPERSATTEQPPQGWRSRASQLAGRAARAGVDLLLPPRCAWCQSDHAELTSELLLCTGCQQTFCGEVKPRCARCGAIGTASTTGFCGHCRGRRLRFDRVVTLGTYAGELRECVLRLKHPGHDALAQAMGQLLVARQPDQLAALQADGVLPVPMHWFRRLVRRTNSAELVAAAVARDLRLPVLRSAVRRVRHTRPQGPMLRTERLQNVRGAFRVIDGASVRGRHLILVDDVLTTGATCDQIARVLRRAGAAKISVAVLARAEGH